MTPDKRQALPLHGVLIEFNGIGVYLIGKSGSGKSETALQLIDQGARLICDDAPEFSNETTKQYLYGSCPEGFYGLMHIRELGIINIMQLAGTEAFKSRQAIHFIIELIPTVYNSDKIQPPQHLLSPNYQQWQHGRWIIPGLRLHLSASRNTALLVKTAVKQFLACDMVSLANDTHN